MRKIWSIKNELLETERALINATFTRATSYHEVHRLKLRVETLKRELTATETPAPTKKRAWVFGVLPVFKFNLK